MRETPSSVVVTLDIDWAPDFVIDAVAATLLSARVPATWFVTHDSPAVRRLAAHGSIFELGLHPNFFPGSSHGATPADVLACCTRLVPGATSLRTHGLYQSSPLLALIMATTDVRRECSLFLPRYPDVSPFVHTLAEGALLRVPYVWEDDYEALQRDPIWELDDFLHARRGVTVLDFHPLHVYLNSATMEPYEALKRLAPRLDHATPAQTEPLVNRGATGAGVAFGRAVAWLARQGGATRLCDVEP